MYVIYSKEDCPFCVKAQTVLGMLQEEFEVRDQKEYQELFQERGWKTVPQIFDNETYVGGYDELRVYLKTK